VVQGPDRFLFVLAAVTMAHAHAAETDGGHGQFFSELPHFHESLLL
jgi:hypothetical protein